MATAPSSVPAARGPVAYGSYVDEVVAYQQTVGGVTSRYYPHYNHLYSVAALTDANGQVVERYKYTAYGKQTITGPTGVVRQVSAVGFDRGFTGYITDSETGLHHARARQYSPTLGRFVGRDPLKYVDGASLYSAYFVPNHVDPSGQNQQEIDSASASLEAMCDKKDCLDRCYCTVEECKAEARKIAEAYVKRVNSIRQWADENANQGDIHFGWKCYEWAGLTQRAFLDLGLKCWSVSWVGFVGGDNALEHNYLYAAVGSSRGAQGPRKDCGRVLDPWRTGKPAVYDGTWKWHDWNYFHDPVDNSGDYWDGTSWKRRKYPPPWTPDEPRGGWLPPCGGKPTP